MLIFFKGLVFGASLIIAIGAQNAFVLKQGLKREYVLMIVSICALADALLIALGAGGMGTLVASRPWLTQLAAWAGAIFLIGYAIFSLRSAFKDKSLELEMNQQPLGRFSAAMTTLAFTFLNPHVYLDTVILLGSLAGQYSGAARSTFALGAMSASFIWFFSLGFGARLLAPLFKRPLAWRVLDSFIACVMLWLAFSLLQDSL